MLAGVHLVFSRVIPLEANPRTHPLWQLAEQFGATCGEQCTEQTTHVVATHGGTEKVRTYTLTVLPGLCVEARILYSACQMCTRQANRSALII